MDFTKRDARGASETAQFCRLRWPESGEYIIDEASGEFVGAMVLGASARSVQAALREEQRAKLTSAKGKDESARALEDIQADLVQSASRVTVGFVNVQRGDSEATADDAAWFYDLNMFSTASLLQPDPKKWQGQSFAQQVLAFSNDASNYLGNGSTG